MKKNKNILSVSMTSEGKRWCGCSFNMVGSHEEHEEFIEKNGKLFSRIICLVNCVYRDTEIKNIDEGSQSK